MSSTNETPLAGMSLRERFYVYERRDDKLETANEQLAALVADIKARVKAIEKGSGFELAAKAECSKSLDWRVRTQEINGSTLTDVADGELIFFGTLQEKSVGEEIIGCPDLKNCKYYLPHRVYGFDAMTFAPQYDKIVFHNDKLFGLLAAKFGVGRLLAVKFGDGVMFTNMNKTDELVNLIHEAGKNPHMISMIKSSFERGINRLFVPTSSF